MAYQKTTWVDHIVDPVTGDVVQQGTKVTATRMNKMEQGIADAQVLTEALAQTVIGSPVISGLEFSASGLTAQWTAGVAYVNGVRFEVNAGSIKLSATQGQYIYLDSDGVLKNTPSQAIADTKCKLWYFATDANSIITSVDSRNIVSKDMFVKQTEVAANGANKIPRLDVQGKGAFSVTGEATGTQAKLDAHTAAADPHTQYALESGANFTGSIKSTSFLPFIVKAAGRKSWVIHKTENSNDFVIAPSGTVDGEDWDWTRSFTFTETALHVAGRSIDAIKEFALLNGTKISETIGQRTAINAESDRLDVVSENGQRFILRAEEGIAAIQFMNFDMLGINKTIRSLKDANGKFRQVDHYRIDGTTLFMRTTLNGTPDANGNYPSMTIKRYKNDGVTEAISVVMPLAYDSDGDYTSFG
ncbi:hypothetical protein POF51_25480 [Brevibacillus sp. AG]|uniref:hypothetical protein n=1 Tax=Brevibacillus sp. AG TaxID=3020891 RepID=UPI00085399CA|nr:hypothetical protein [Brevibacillus sp. AG]MDC0764073.1 hypothetical protein [Brevibacillus sp. AG]